MPGGDRNIRPEDNPKPFKKGQSGNPKGRPKKTFAEHTQDIKDMGYKAPTRGEFYEMVAMLLSMNEDDLKAYQQDKQRPYWIRLIIKDLGNKHMRSRLMADHRDWLYGKSKENMDLKVNGQFKLDPIEINIKMPSDDE